MDLEISLAKIVCDEFAYEILFVDDILQPFQFELVFTAFEIQAKNYLVLVP